jgi:hypothetical protein
MQFLFFFSTIICTASEHKMLLASDSMVYSNKSYRMLLFRENGKVNRFKIYNVKNSAVFAGKPELITIDGKVPEGTNRFDYNNPNDQMGYPCDSTYRYLSNSYKVVFAIEKGTKKRMDLSIYNSTDRNFKDGDHTLVRK